MSDETPRPSSDIVDEALGKALGRLLNGPSVEYIASQIRLVMERAVQLNDPAKPIIIGQVNVLTVITGWLRQSTEHPLHSLNAAEAASEIMQAIEAGLLGREI